MIRTIGKIEEFKPIIKVGEDTYLVSWGMIPELEKEYKKDEKGEIVMDEKGNPIVVSEKESKVLATWCIERYNYLPSLTFLANMVKNSNAPLIPSEIQAMADYLKEDGTEIVRDILMEAISRYDLDETNGVNALYLNGQKVWFDKVLRASIERQIQARKDAGQATAPIAFGLNVLQIPVDLGLQMLAQLEIYASDCYNQTLAHKAAVQNMSVEDMVKYDYKAGYPEKLRFDLPA